MLMIINKQKVRAMVCRQHLVWRRCFACELIL